MIILSYTHVTIPSSIRLSLEKIDFSKIVITTVRPITILDSRISLPPANLFYPRYLLTKIEELVLHHDRNEEEEEEYLTNV